MINRSNYEEYFILYMDNELDAAGKLMVERFVAQHPQLKDELEMLMSTKLPLDNVFFQGKEELFSQAMKLEAVDENLLLYIDDELPAAERKAVEEKITADNDYALQHSLLMQTKLDSAETVAHPNKKELYRQERKVMPFGIWMRIAAAVVLLLTGSLFYFRTADKALPVHNGGEIVKHVEKRTPVQLPTTTTPIGPSIKKTTASVADVTSAARTADKSVDQQLSKPRVVVQKNQQRDVASVIEQPVINQQPKVVRVNANQLTNEQKIGEDIAFSEPVTHTSVTSTLSNRTTGEDTQEPAVTDDDFKDTKKTPARGFFRKVSRFIERKTGIGTANADNELLIGAVALKLK